MEKGQANRAFANKAMRAWLANAMAAGPMATDSDKAATSESSISPKLVLGRGGDLREPRAAATAPTRSTNSNYHNTGDTQHRPHGI